MDNPNLSLLEAAVKLLEPLLDDLVFVGGCATGLLITDPAAVGIRATNDVDAITEARPMRSTLPCVSGFEH